MVRIVTGFALATALAFAFGACATAQEPPRAPPTPEQRFADRLAGVACAGVARCCASRRLGSFDVVTCEALVR
ncbi:MAG TPA: hypothetical protein VHB21_24160, partial [Minicystis sp.]|nr:hypothetical protein [Minicystis sp.]